MNLTEAKQILKANGYSLMKEMYDPPVDTCKLQMSGIYTYKKSSNEN